MDSANTPKFRDVGLAEARYLTPDDFAYKREVTSCIRRLAQPEFPPPTLLGRVMARKRAQKLLRQADRYEACGLEYALIGCRDCGGLFMGPKRCETRICESCSRKYGARLRKRQLEIVKKVQPKGKKRHMFLTLTQRTQPDDLPTTYDARRILDNARELVNHFWPKKKGCGAIAVLEVGENFNLHVHVLVYGQYEPQADISSYWEQLAPNSPVIWISEVREAKRHVNYLLKYIAKPPKMKTPEKLAWYLKMIVGLRRVRTWGEFYNFKLAAKEPCPCLLCGGQLRYIRSDYGNKVPARALFWEEATEMIKGSVN